MNKEYLAFDDVMILPNYSEVKSRSDCNTNTLLTRRYGVCVPIVSSPMDTVTESEMAIAMMKLGGCGIIHRFMSIEAQIIEITKVKAWMKSTNDLEKGSIWEQWGVYLDNWHSEIHQIPVAAAIGVTGDYIERAIKLVAAGVNIICIDVAHGHTLLMKTAINALKTKLPDHVDIIAGNIVTSEATKDLIQWQVDGIRCGLGNGSRCLTRIKTGIGVPQITVIKDCQKETADYSDYIPLIADGGIRNPGDVAKAIVAGADSVMIGSLLSGTKETPGEISKQGTWPNEILYKKYRGSASLETKMEHNLDTKNVEGESVVIPYKGKTKRIIYDILDGLKSSMSYVGALNMLQFYAKAKFIKITNNGYIESIHHLKLNK